MNNTQKKILKISFIVIFIILFIGHWINNIKEKKEVLFKNKTTIGWLFEYDDGGADFSAKSVIYSYEVLGKIFSREVNVTVGFKKCENFEEFKDKRYWIIYSPDSPEKSLINLEIEIQGIENPEFPETLDDFK
ncbi:MAG: hypothetical protein IMY72_04735 [Bacteroidetes bacterium]|nr:hypothetical protein [Bacteroidota bacterium]